MITSSTRLIAGVRSGRLDDFFDSVYGKESSSFQKNRYASLLEQLSAGQTDCPTLCIVAPGRTELGGNHTDHNHGCVLAAAVDLDCVAAVSPVAEPEVVLVSDRYPEPIRVNLGTLDPRPEEYGTPESLVRGVAAAFLREKETTHGFHGYIHATCLEGSGLSSSAAFSILVGGAFNFLYENGIRTARQLALIAQQAENDYFDKPCGLMDQMASSVGGTTFMDFAKPEDPVVIQLDCSLSEIGYRLVIIDTGGSHVGLTAEYAAVNQEMRAAARVLGQEVGRGLRSEAIRDAIPEIRQQAGDRAVLRLLHFVEENERVQRMAHFMQNGSFPEFLQEVEASGISSCNLLQNCATVSSSREQGIRLALALSKRSCPAGVCRVHGGGFAGTVQAWIPTEEFAAYRGTMEAVFGPGSVIPVRFGRPGVCSIEENGPHFPDLNFG